jgi:hypothetical protein
LATERRQGLASRFKGDDDNFEGNNRPIIATVNFKTGVDSACIYKSSSFDTPRLLVQGQLLGTSAIHHPTMSRVRASVLRNAARLHVPSSPVPSISRLIPSIASCRHFDTDAGSRTTDIPDYSHYLTKSPHDNARVFQYFIVGAFGALTAVGGKATVTDFLATMGASADVLAMAKVEVDLTKIPEAKNLIIKYFL